MNIQDIKVGITYIAQHKSLVGGNRCKVIAAYVNKDGLIYCRNLTNQNYCHIKPEAFRFVAR